MPLRLFRSRERSGAYIARMLFLGAMIGFFYFTTQYLQGVLGFTPLQAGLGFFPMTVVNFAVALSVPRLTRRIGQRSTARRRLRGHLPGYGVAQPARLGDSYLCRGRTADGPDRRRPGPRVRAADRGGIAGSPPDAGAASGLVNTAHQLGSALGLGVLVAVSDRRRQRAPRHPRPSSLPTWAPR